MWGGWPPLLHAVEAAALNRVPPPFLPSFPPSTHLLHVAKHQARAEQAAHDVCRQLVHVPKHAPAHAQARAGYAMWQGRTPPDS